MITRLLAFAPKLKNFTVLGVLFSVLSFYGTHLFYSEKITALELELSKKNSAQIENVLMAERAATQTMREIQALMSDQTIITEKRYNELHNSVEDTDPVGLDDPEWVRHHDEAVPAGGALPGTTPTTDRTDEAVTGVQDDKSELEIVMENYKSCQIVVDRLQGWKLWYERLQQHGRK